MKILITLAALTLPIFGFAMDISAKSAIIIDAGSGKVLWERDADVLRYPASTTKIMTGMLLLERCLPDDLITAPVGIDKVPPSSMHLKPNEQVSAKDMLYALMLRSANDGAVAVADHVSGSIPAFAELMNERAREIGCRSTHFHNPNGLNDPEHVTTARDLAMIAREAMKYEAFREVVRTRKYQIQRTINQKDLFMVTRNRWLYKDSTADGKLLAESAPLAPGKSDWQQVALDFKTLPEMDGITLTITRQVCSAEGGVCPIFGTVWYDDFNLQLVGREAGARTISKGK